LYFAANGALSAEQFYNNENQKIVNYPNPFSSSTTIVLLDPSQFINIQVFDLLGRIVDAQKINITNASYKAKYNAPRLSMGIYKYRLMNDHNKIYSGTFIIK
jgi:thymidine kinase